MSPREHADAAKALEKAVYAIKNAEYDLKGGFFAATANRAYYACYYCISALLYTQNIYSKTHQGARAKFAELFIKTAIFPIEISDSITTLFNYRQEADYDLNEDITQQEAEVLVNKAKEIYSLALAYFQNSVLQ